MSNYPCLRALLLMAMVSGCVKRDQPQLGSSSSAVNTIPPHQWKELADLQGMFTVMMPGIPQEVFQEMPGPSGKMKLTAYTVELKDQRKTFAVMFFDYPALVDLTDEATVYVKLDAGLAAYAKSLNVEQRKRRKIKLGIHYGLEGLFENAAADKSYLCRIYLVGNRLYQLHVVWQTSADVPFADLGKFTNSFTVEGVSPLTGSSFAEIRRAHKTKLIQRDSAKTPPPDPPNDVFRVVRYDSPVGKLAAYLTPAPKGGSKRPAVIWITGGDCNSIDEGFWQERPSSNDQSASAFRKAGIVMMFPSLRGGNDNPGTKEGFLGEVDDVLAAADFLAKQDFVDPKRIYLGGHSTGGTLALLVAERSDRFRAVFSFGPVDDVSKYATAYTPFDKSNATEVGIRSPGRWLGCINGPTFVFEGVGRGNISALRSMAKDSKNANLKFLPVRGADHCSILAPMTSLIAEKILRDEGPISNLSFVEREIDKLFPK